MATGRQCRHRSCRTLDRPATEEPWEVRRIPRRADASEGSVAASGLGRRQRHSCRIGLRVSKGCRDTTKVVGIPSLCSPPVVQSDQRFLPARPSERFAPPTRFSWKAGGAHEGNATARGSLTPLWHERAEVKARLKRDEKTSQRLGLVRQKHTKPELQVRTILRELGWRYRLHVRGLPGSPDVANQSAGWAIFVHGCFWHAHPRCRLATLPKRNRAFWRSKLIANRKRDLKALLALRRTGITTLVIWGCETHDIVRLKGKLQNSLAAHPGNSRDRDRLRPSVATKQLKSRSRAQRPCLLAGPKLSLRRWRLAPLHHASDQHMNPDRRRRNER
jgi:DNA mismatch endonuclease (patch repair protein)